MGSLLGFKIIAVLFYFFINLFISNQIFTFIIIVILNSFDFWVVKNICGRKLVGLRWWSEIQENGEEKWIYESPNSIFVVNEANSNIFWMTQVIYTAIWSVLVFLNLISLRFFWLLLDLICSSLAAINTMGYYKCRGGISSLIRTPAASKPALFEVRNEGHSSKHLIIILIHNQNFKFWLNYAFALLHR